MSSDETVNTERIDNVRIIMRRHMTTHPNLISVWENYLNIRIKKINQSLEECEKLEERINAGHPDLTLEQIYMLGAVFNRLGVASTDTIDPDTIDPDTLDPDTLDPDTLDTDPDN